MTAAQLLALGAVKCSGCGVWSLPSAWPEQPCITCEDPSLKEVFTAPGTPGAETNSAYAVGRWKNQQRYPDPTPPEERQTGEPSRTQTAAPNLGV